MTNVWMKNGTRLGWLIDPFQEKVWIYREGGDVKEIREFAGKVLNGEQIMPGMELPLEELMD